MMLMYALQRAYLKYGFLIDPLAASHDSTSQVGAVSLGMY